jgi:D-3-phosphoglycerate dehydrogenase / 2-oxoglutarate reductase
MDFKVVLTSRVLTKKETTEYGQRLGVEFATIPCRTEDDVIGATHDADAVVTLMQPYSRRVMEKLARCKLIYNGGTGFDSIDVQAATDHGICVAYPGDYCMEEVAEHAMALVVACARKIPRLDRAVRAGKWETFERREIRSVILPPLYPLKGRTLGLIGFGRIGHTMVPMARGFGLKVIAYDPRVSQEAFGRPDVEGVTFDELLAGSDFITIQASSSPETKHMFRLEQFRKMKPTAYIINVARGSFIDEEALYTALSEGMIAGAGLDVVDGEQGGVSPDRPLLTLDNVIVTGHSAFYSEESAARYRQRIVDAVASIVHGTWPEWLINPEVKENYLKRWK